MKKSACLGLLLLVFFFISGHAIAKPSPPPELMEILAEFSEVEEKFEDGDWESARESLSEISAKYDAVYAEYEGVLSRKLNNHFNNCCDKFKINLVVRDEEQTRKSFVTLRLVLFDIMDHFNYEIHPVIALMQKFIGDEAKEALEKGDYGEVQSEIEEVYAFFKDSTSMLKTKGVGQEAVDSFFNDMKVAMSSAAKQDKQTLELTLDQLETQLVAFQDTIK